MLENGLYTVAPGKVAAVVTHLEMSAAAAARPLPADLTVHPIRRVVSPGVEWYRDLFYRVGGREWLWFSRLSIPDEQLSAILQNPNVEVYCVDVGGVAEGLLELDFRRDGACELAYFGLAPCLIGKGMGRALMNFAIDRAWARPIERFHVHTCTLDSPQAMGFYRKSGFVPVRQEIEIADDPRLTGALPECAGRGVPLLRP